VIIFHAAPAACGASKNTACVIDYNQQHYKESINLLQLKTVIAMVN